MTDQKKSQASQVLSIIMMVLPVVILMNVGNELTDNSGMRVLYAGIFGGIGGLLGATANHFTKDKTNLIKIIASIGLILLCGFILHFFSSTPTDDQIMEQEWEIQQIGTIEFETPSKLKLQSEKVPESTKWFYETLKVYTDNNKKRLTSFIQSTILVDTIPIENAFNGALDGIFKKIDVDIEEVKFDFFEADEIEIAAMFTFNKDNTPMNGYGYMFKDGNILESIWLTPITKSFSREYIEEFDLRIYVDD